MNINRTHAARAVGMCLTVAIGLHNPMISTEAADACKPRIISGTGPRAPANLAETGAIAAWQQAAAAAYGPGWSDWAMAKEVRRTCEHKSLPKRMVRCTVRAYPCRLL